MANNTFPRGTYNKSEELFGRSISAQAVKPLNEAKI
jgi:hypothetical protein